ncbi:MAG: helix-turn-helix transcriptional regulator [Peptostreptococcaceae bacterium]
MNLIKLGEILKRRRKELKLSLRDAGTLLSLSHNYISILEKAKDPKSNMPIKPTIETLELISKGYNLDINILLDLCGFDFKIAPKENNNNLEEFYYDINNLQEDSLKQLKEYLELLKLKENNNKSKGSSVLKNVN